MAVTVLKRPLGFILSSTENSITVSNSSGSALFTKTSHGLTTGDYVFIKTTVKDYNGFFYVNVVSANTFKIRKYATGSDVSYIADTSGTYQENNITHGWNCVHLPIIYKLRSNKYPTNEQDTGRTVSSYTNENGYTNLNLSGSIGTFADELEYVKISGAASSEVNGVWQIINKISTSDITINLVFSNAYSFSGATVIFYYANYHVKVRVYGGLNASHYWTAHKPYEILATLDLIPDENNEVIFSISDILKSHITTRNELLLGTLPNNLDFWTMFYIEFAEAYDHNNGYTLDEFVSSYTSDQSNFEGYAANSKLDFKNRYSGVLSEYLAVPGAVAKFLTLFTDPVFFLTAAYHDISFIFPYRDMYPALYKRFMLNGVQQTTSLDTFGLDYDEGVFRRQITGVTSNYDAVIIRILGQPMFPSLNQWTNRSTGVDWTISNTPQVILGGGQTSKKYSSNPVQITNGFTYSIAMSITSTAADVFAIAIVDDSDNELVADEFTLSIGTLDYNRTITLTSGTGRRLIFRAGSGTAMTVTVNSFEVARVNLTEELEYKISNDCSSQDINLTWLNNLGGFDYWTFSAKKDYLTDITETGETSVNIFPEYPESYGEFADTDRRKQTYRESRKQIVVRSQFVTLEQLQAISYLKSSVLVQIIESQYDRRTVLVDSDSFTVYKEDDKLYSISFTITYTDDISSQDV